ncbi:hypothetical protein SAMN05444581_10299 [Methylocapsa palsarum]|uniref:Uncharacterized protein n=1 Tax=Methylocapsa palsarum TaxID=1612308 RepID=A0A1I3WRT8_9HYPH|nr:hypothetical protein SAMN05444581_10299 [Methylocapsa palsarum]
MLKLLTLKRFLIDRMTFMRSESALIDILDRNGRAA